DGDHGINMNKGFTITGTRLEGKDLSFSEAIETLGDVLVSEIGGSMGPIYGSLFLELGDVSAGEDEIGKETYVAMWEAALEAVLSLGSAKLGDKTMLDTMIPAVEALNTSVGAGKSFAESLKEMCSASEEGMKSTKDMVAKIGRSARLGERSRGVLDAGAVSCNLIIESMAETITSLLNE
ncbi:MAG: dihydroxyacetone kinase subunit L, partial [Sphaerochaetaceae bacterium]|nr:dihydroxyacetone kinase subunit L [Sphaerochaetaceae bacterium]